MARTTHSRGWPGRFAVLFFISLSALAVKEMRLSDAAAAVNDHMPAVVGSRIFPDKKHHLREHYTGIASLDYGLQFLVAAFLPGAAGWDKGFQIQQIYFLVSFFAIIVTLSVEAGRKGNTRGWTRLYAMSLFPLLF